MTIIEQLKEEMKNIDLSLKNISHFVKEVNSKATKFVKNHEDRKVIVKQTVNEILEERDLGDMKSVLKQFTDFSLYDMIDTIEETYTFAKKKCPCF
jgi:uncharacterized membrane-anchored protein